MTKAELIDGVATKCEMTKKLAGCSIDATIEAITAALSKGDGLTLVGFGTFSVVQRAARKGRNPQTGKEIKIKARKVVKFKPGKNLKEEVA